MNHEGNELVNRTYPSVEATDDVEAHRMTVVDGDGDAAEGHILRRDADPLLDDPEDVEGHMQPPRDLDIDRI